MNTPPQDTLKVITSLLTFLADDVPDLLGLDDLEDLDPGSNLHDAKLMAEKARDLLSHLAADIGSAAEDGAATALSIISGPCGRLGRCDFSNFNDSLPDLIAQRIVLYEYLKSIGRC